VGIDYPFLKLKQLLFNPYPANVENIVSF